MLLLNENYLRFRIIHAIRPGNVLQKLPSKSTKVIRSFQQLFLSMPYEYESEKKGI